MTLLGLGGLAAMGAAAIFLAQPGTAQGANLFPFDDPAAVARGEEIYTAQCAACHGAALEGQPDWRSPAANGRLPAPPHDETGHTWHHPDPQLFLITKYGTAALVGGNYESDMPGFEDVLSDQEILEVLAYIKSTWPENIRARHTEMNAGIELDG